MRTAQEIAITNTMTFLTRFLIVSFTRDRDGLCLRRTSAFDFEVGTDLLENEDWTPRFVCDSAD
jgi:hypothetical protein